MVLPQAGTRRSPSAHSGSGPCAARDDGVWWSYSVDTLSFHARYAVDESFITPCPETLNSRGFQRGMPVNPYGMGVCRQLSDGPRVSIAAMGVEHDTKMLGVVGNHHFALTRQMEVVEA